MFRGEEEANKYCKAEAQIHSHRHAHNTVGNLRKRNSGTGSTCRNEELISQHVSRPCLQEKHMGQFSTAVAIKAFSISLYKNREQ